MENNIVDLKELNNSKIEKPEKPSKNKKKKPFSFIVIFIFTILIVFSTHIAMSDKSNTSWFSRLPIIKQIKQLAESADRQLKGEDIDRINILLLGIGGVAHEGGYLTDTIMVASLKPSTKQVSITSIPRDLAVPIEDMGWQKINSINAYAEMEKPGSGGLATSQAISDILQMPIDYFVRVDFQGFINIINEIDGIEVDVDNTLNDYKYPVMGREEAEDYESRFEHLHIEKGLQTMDGDLALKYARSRHATGVEGSDFARAKRQQKVILAAKNKLLSLKILLNPAKITNILDELNKHISTNLQIWEIVKLWSNFKDINKNNIKTKVLDNSPNGLLVDSRSEIGAYILAPRNGDFTEIQYFTQNVFADAPSEEINAVVEEEAKVEIRNGTWINGLASKTATDIEKYGFIVTKIGNSSRQNLLKSTIYDLSYGEKSESLEILKHRTNADVAFGMPEWLIEEISQEAENDPELIQPDFLLILGQDADKTESGIENKEEEIE